MNIIRRTIDIDADTDARLRELAAERGQDVAAVLAEAVALLCSTRWSTSPAPTLRRIAAASTNSSAPVWRFLSMR